MGTNFRVHIPYVQPKSRRNDGSRHRSNGPTHRVSHQGDVIWALGSKAKHEIMRGQWGRELKDVDLSELLRLFKKTFIPARNVFHSRAQFFNIKQEDNETLNEYWKRLVDIERKFEFNRIAPEEIITYKFAATINDKKARDKFIKELLKLQMVLETIEQDNYNRKYGDKKPNKKHRKLPSDSSSSEEQVAYTHPAQKRKIKEIGMKKLSNRNCYFCSKPNWSLEHICPARRAQCTNCKKVGHFAKVCKSKTVNRSRKNHQRTATPNHGQKSTISNPSTASTE